MTKIIGVICGGVIKLKKCVGCGEYIKNKNYKLTFLYPEGTLMALREVIPVVCRKCKKKGVKLKGNEKPYYFSMIY